MGYERVGSRARNPPTYSRAATDTDAASVAPLTAFPTEPEMPPVVERWRAERS
jgi:hypothetical protein